MNEAIRLHGEAPTMAFEALGVACVAFLLFRSSGADFQNVNLRSVAYAIPMALCTAGGLWSVMKAMSLMPNKLPAIAAVSGLYPMGNLLLVSIVVVFGLTKIFPTAELPSGREFFGIVVLGCGFMITFWPSIKDFFVRG